MSLKHGTNIGLDFSEYYNYVDLIDKLKGKLQAWKGKMLSYGGKELLISSILQSIPIYTLSLIVPPICVIKKLYRVIANTGQHGIMYVFLKRKVDLVLDIYLIFQRPYMLNYGGNSGHNKVCG